MSSYKLSEINIYPVKSLPGISLQSSEVEERGFKFDRRWMLVDEENKFMTQRLFPQMVFINIKLEKDCLEFSHKNKLMSPLKISASEFPSEKIDVRIWEDMCRAVEYGEEVSEWFSSVIDFKCRLVYMPDTTMRKTSTEFFDESKNVSFADGYPYLIIGERSLEHLNSKLDKPAEMSQFRPNLVFSGIREHEEDEWKKIQIGSIVFAVVKPCARCVITTIDTETGKKNKEPLSTLSSYRNLGNKILFGQNAIALTKGSINVGDKIKILDS